MYAVRARTYVQYVYARSRELNIQNKLRQTIDVIESHGACTEQVKKGEDGV